MLLTQAYPKIIAFGNMDTKDKIFLGPHPLLQFSQETGSTCKCRHQTLVLASCESTTECVDKWLQPIMQNLPSALRDTTHCVNLTESVRLDKDVVLASIDVSSLYTSSPHEEGIQACINTLREQADPDPMRPPPEVVGELMNTVLRNNVFTFNIIFKSN